MSDLSDTLTCKSPKAVGDVMRGALKPLQGALSLHPPPLVRGTLIRINYISHGSILLVAPCIQNIARNTALLIFL